MSTEFQIGRGIKENLPVEDNIIIGKIYITRDTKQIFIGDEVEGIKVLLPLGGRLGRIDETNSEIFNDYENNKANGEYNFVEGYSNHSEGKVILNIPSNQYINEADAELEYYTLNWVLDYNQTAYPGIVNFLFEFAIMEDFGESKTPDPKEDWILKTSANSFEVAEDKLEGNGSNTDIIIPPTGSIIYEDF